MRAGQDSAASAGRMGRVHPSPWPLVPTNAPASLPSLPQQSRMVTLYIQCCRSLKACVGSFNWRSHWQGCDTSCMTTISDFSDHPQMPPFPRMSVTFLSHGPLNISVRPFPNQARWCMMINSALICSDSHPSTCWQRSPSNCC